jgi:hypothetical protein
VTRVETWTSVDGSRTGSERWTKCSAEGRTIPQCLIMLIFTPGTYDYLGLQFFTGPSAGGPWTLSTASSLRSYKFVNSAPHDYTGGGSFGTTVCISP